MKMRIAKKVAALFLGIGFVVATAYGGDLSVMVKYPFKADGKNYPAGHYRILADADGDHINLLNLDKKTDDPIRFVTRLSPREGQLGQVVFDKVGNDLYLAEVYIIGMDGFFFNGAPGKHKHLVLREEEPK